MIDRFISEFDNPTKHIKVDLGKEKPLWQYIKQAIQDIEIINMLGLNPIDDSNSVTPFINCINWEWNPHPPASEIQDRRRETGDKLSTKYIENTRIGILKFDIFCGARDKNKFLETRVIPNKVYATSLKSVSIFVKITFKNSNNKIVGMKKGKNLKNTSCFKNIAPMINIQLKYPIPCIGLQTFFTTPKYSYIQIKLAINIKPPITYSFPNIKIAVIAGKPINVVRILFKFIVLSFLN